MSPGLGGIKDKPGKLAQGSEALLIRLPERPPGLVWHTLSSGKGWLDTTPWPKACLQEPSPVVSSASCLVPAHSLVEEVTRGATESHVLSSGLGCLNGQLVPLGGGEAAKGAKVWDQPEPTLGPPGSGVGHQATTPSLSPQF